MIPPAELDDDVKDEDGVVKAAKGSNLDGVQDEGVDAERNRDENAKPNESGIAGGREDGTPNGELKRRDRVKWEGGATKGETDARERKKRKEEEEEEDERSLTKKWAILRFGVSRRAVDILLIKIGCKGFYPLGVFVLLFYANTVAKMYIPLTTFTAWVPHHCCKVNGSLVEEVSTIDGFEPSQLYLANWSYNDRKHLPDPPPKSVPKRPVESPSSSEAAAAKRSSGGGASYRLNRLQHRRHRLHDFQRSVKVQDDQSVCASLVKEYGWSYATQPSYSLVADLDLGCRNATHLVQISNAIFMAGFGIGGLIHGTVADFHGRRIVLIYSSLLLPVTGGLTAALEDETYFIAMRFVQGFFQGGVLLSSSTMICELFPSSMRAIPHIMCQMGNVIGFSLLDLTAYLERRWRVLVLILPLFFIGAISFVCVIPESLEWLLMTGQVKRACHQLQCVLNSRQYKVDVYDELFSSVAASQKESRLSTLPTASFDHVGSTVASTGDSSLDQNKDIEDSDDVAAPTAEVGVQTTSGESLERGEEEEEWKEEEKTEAENEMGRATDEEEVEGDQVLGDDPDEVFERQLLLKMVSLTSPPWTKSTRRCSFAMIVVVTAVAILTLINYFVYYGLVLATDEFTGDRFLNFFLFALADLAGVIIALAFISALERRWIVCGAYCVIIMAACTILVIDFTIDKSKKSPYYDHLVLGGHLVIKISILAAVAVIELSAVEMPPTVIRSIASGIFFACKGVAGVTASFVSFLLRVDSYAESVFLVLAALALALVMALPEMKNATIPRNEEDLKKNFRNTKFKYTCLNF